MINFWSIDCIAQWSGKSRVTALRRRGLFRMMILDGLGRGSIPASTHSWPQGLVRGLSEHDRP
jgi:hypothetical protein